MSVGGTASAGHGEDHLRPRDLAAYLDGGASEDLCLEVEDHLSLCSDCCEDLLAAARLRAEPGTVVRPRNLVGASVAIAALLGFLVVGQPWREDAGPSSGPTERASGTTPVVTGTLPAEGAVLEAGEVRFAWRATGGEGALYELVVTTEEGDSVWAAATRDTTLVLPASADLAPGRTYLWYVDVLMADGRPASSGVRHFQLAP